MGARKARGEHIKVRLSRESWPNTAVGAFVLFQHKIRIKCALKFTVIDLMRQMSGKPCLFSRASLGMKERARMRSYLFYTSDRGTPRAPS